MSTRRLTMIFVDPRRALRVAQRAVQPQAGSGRREGRDDRYVVSFRREKTIFRSKQIEILTREKRAAAEAAGFDGAYLRFTGEMTLEHYRRVQRLRQ